MGKSRLKQEEGVNTCCEYEPRLKQEEGCRKVSSLEGAGGCLARRWGRLVRLSSGGISSGSEEVGSSKNGARCR